MGKGDIKTKRGKLFNGSYGVTRPRKKVKAYAPAEEKKSAE
ncbi:MAG: 30S ribosomal protein THX [Bacteroidales bacterium]|nr:30S ribosomal protein THX [Bacteroidales bacterium]